MVCFTARRVGNNDETYSEITFYQWVCLKGEPSKNDSKMGDIFAEMQGEAEQSTSY